MLVYLVIINIISFILYGIDKFLAISNHYRISEFLLLSLGFIGGVVGSIFGMFVFRHKIRKNKFKIILCMYLCMWLFILFKFY